MEEKTACQKVYTYLEQGIKSGTFPCGTHIPSEKQLGETLSVSKIAVRQAIDQLVGMGLIKKRRGAKSTVEQVNTTDALDTILPIMQVTNDDVIKLLEFRSGFETTNVHLLEKHMTSDTLHHLESCLQKMKDNATNNKFYIYDYDFHYTVAVGTQNPFVIRISKFLMDLLKQHLAKLNMLIGPEIGLKYHQLILDAIKDNDFEIAARYMEKHMEVTLKAVEKEIGSAQKKQDI
jgi:GntR family transcriptional repressor for pyruvate dehydrogenase complex